MASAVPTPTYCLTTWNTQGSIQGKQDPSKIDKVTTLQSILAKGKTNILFLQEAGDGETALPGYQEFSGVSVGGYSGRCTCKIMVPTGSSAQAFSLQNDDPNAAAFVTGGVAGRTPVAVSIGKTLLISMHTTANGAPADTKALIDHLNKNKRYASFDLIVVSADFNCEPGLLQTSLTPREAERIVPPSTRKFSRPARRHKAASTRTKASSTISSY